MPKRIIKSAVISVFLLLTIFLLSGPSFAEGNVCDGCAAGSFNGLPACVKDGNLHICKENFPDENFRKFLIAQYDTDQDSFLTGSQVDDITEMYCNDQNLSSLEGIGYFSNLGDLYCRDNKLTCLDLSANRKLFRIDCCANRLESLTLPKEALKWLHCAGNKLKELDLSNAQSLFEVNCDQNQLTSLDLSGAIVRYLYCGSNKLEALDLSNQIHLTVLNCNNNKLKTLNLEDLTQLVGLNCKSNQLTELDISGMPNLEYLYCGNNHLTQIDLSVCPSLAYADLGTQTPAASIDIRTSPGTQECTVDLSPLVGLENIGKIANISFPGSWPRDFTYDAETGIVKIEDYVQRLLYEYRPTGLSGKLTSAPVMQVTVTLSCQHTWKEPTCTTESVCTGCGESNGKRAPHAFAPATVTHPEKCTVCGYVDPNAHPLEHVWLPANCVQPQRCRYCSKTVDSPLGHVFPQSRCQEKVQCTRCNSYTINKELHSWEQINCVRFKCTKCGKTEKTGTEHTWSEPSLFLRPHCLHCNAKTGSSYIEQYFFVILAVIYPLELAASVWYLLDYKRERKY